MPLPPPTENVSYYTKLGVRYQRPAGSYLSAYDNWNYYDYHWYKRKRDWVRVPKGFRDKTNPYSSWVYQVDPHRLFGLTHQSYKNGKYADHIYGGHLMAGLSVESWLSGIVTVDEADPIMTEVRNAVLKKAAGATFSGAVFAAEANKTLSLLTTNATKIFRSFQAIRLGKLRGTSLKQTIKNALREIGILHPKPFDPRASRSSQWLEYRYGVETLLMDVRDAAEYAASKASDQPEQMSWTAVRRHVTETVSDLPPDITMPVGITGNAKTPPKRTWAIVTTAKAWIRARLETSGYRSMQQSGFANPVGLAWDLFPYSFVADWALDIGSYLELQTALWGLEVLDSGYSMQREGFVTLTANVKPGQTWSFFGNDYLTPVWSGDTEMSAKGSRYQRWVWSNPSPEYTLGSGLNIKRGIDSVALLFSSRSR